MSRLLEVFGLTEAQPGNTGRGPTRDPDVPKSFGGGVREPKMPPASKDKPAAGPQIYTGAEQEGGQGARLTADAKTLEALASALDYAARKGNEWAEEAGQAIDMALRKSPTGQTTVTLPKFEDSPGLDDFDDSDGGSDEEY
jgi:hypothetical protein